ncbi:MAG: transglycosylase domain-containing protein [Gemmatimonadales bacterium]
MSARERLTQLRQRFRTIRGARWARLTGRALIGGGALGLLGIGAEAVVRARIAPPETRVPSTVYSRPTAWGNARRARPIPIGPVRTDLAESRIPARLGDIPDEMVEAVLAVEDQRYFEHGGLDLRRIGGALLANIRAGGVVQGGSTITQQLAKNLFLSADRTALRKLREAAMASVLEREHTKTEILEAYLNEIYLGQDGRLAIHGVGAAARYYFGKRLDDLSLGEAATLAGMIQAPNRYSPIRHPETARDRRDLVLGLMEAQGRASERSVARAKRERLRASAHPADRLEARYFLSYAAGAGFGRLPQRGAAIFTTIEPTLQRAAERAVSEARRDDPQAALVALDPRTGDVLAMVGGRDFATSQFNRATEALRQPGSAFKPIVALAALSRGKRGPAFTLASVVPDEPFSVATPAGQWAPRNYDRSFRGPVTFREALEQSLNVPFARIGMEIGPDRIVETARRLGISSRLQAVPSLALGSSEVTLLELTRAYGVFASGGLLAETRAVYGKTRIGTDEVELPEPSVERVVDPAEVFLVTSALEGVIARGTGRGLEEFDRWGELAGKSGTSNDWRDARLGWPTRLLVAGAWVEHDDGTSSPPDGRAGGPADRAPLPPARRPGEAEERFEVPEGVEEVRLARSDGGWWGTDCDPRPEVFLEGTAPEDRCDGYAPRWRSRHADDWVRALERRAEELANMLAERYSSRRRGRR